MATKLFVGNLSFRTTSEELRDLFAQVGTVESASIIEDRDTGRSRGFGFVEMATAEEATAAIEQFHGKDLGGRNLTVNEAKPKAERGGNRNFGNRGGGYNDGGGGRGRDRNRNGNGNRFSREPRW
jgi:cold-inducible RNA-binding protein